MEYLEYDLELTEEECEVRDAAHDFALNVLRPAGIEIDRMSPAEAVAASSPIWDVIKQASELGYTRLAGPADLGGLELSPRAVHIVEEELSWGSVGLAGTLFLCSTVADTALATLNQEAIAEFAAPYYASSDGSMIACWAITEPDHGSDTLGMASPDLRVSGRAQLTARSDGDDYVISGQKSAWVSNGPIATHVMLNVQLEGSSGFHDCGVCLMPLDQPGVSRGPALDKHGVRSLTQGELFFDEVRVPKRWMVVGADRYAAHMDAHLTAFNAGVSVMALGAARAAYDATLAYTKERVQGGRPIFEHQSVRARLFRMFSLVQASRTLSRSVFVHNLSKLGSGQPGELQHSIAAKVFCTDAAVEVCTLAVQLHGGNGLTKEYPLEMFLRDAMAFTVADGENALLSQIAASRL